MTDSPTFRDSLHQLLADRHSAEAMALGHTLLKYVNNRVRRVSLRCGSALSPSEGEDCAAEVMVQLLSGGLVRFRGDSLPELLAFVRTISDRTTWRAIRRRSRERAALAADDTPPWTPVPQTPDQLIEWVPDSPLPAEDQTYLLELLRSGSKAELARRQGVSRAAVTQRVKRILVRVAGLTSQERLSHEAWLQRGARRAIEEEIGHFDTHLGSQ